MELLQLVKLFCLKKVNNDMEKKTFTGTISEINQFLFKFDKNIEYDITIDKHRNKRSLNANAYSWKLQNEIANQLRVSKEEVHFQMLKDYGQRDYVSILANVNPNDHFDYFEEQGIFKHSGNTFKSYLIYKPTHKYTSKEMSIFINGVVQEAKNLGIETLEDKELNEMIKEMEKYE